MKFSLPATGCAMLALCAGCAEVPRMPSDDDKLISEVTSRIDCELATNYNNFFKGKPDGGIGFDTVSVGYTITIDAQREWSAGISPFTYFRPVQKVLNFDFTPSIDNNAHRLVKVTYNVEPAKLAKTVNIGKCDNDASSTYYQFYPGNFRTQDWFEQIANAARKPSDLGYTVDFTTTWSVSGDILREAGRYSAKPGGMFKRTTKNIVDFAFTFGKGKSAAEKHAAITRTLDSLQGERQTRQFE